MINSLYNEAT